MGPSQRRFIIHETSMYREYYFINYVYEFPIHYTWFAMVLYYYVFLEIQSRMPTVLSILSPSSRFQTFVSMQTQDLR